MESPGFSAAAIAPAPRMESGPRLGVEPTTDGRAAIYRT